jgi:hypothetical protein
MLTTAERDVILGTYDSHYVGWISAITNWRTGDETELSYTGYARAAVTFGAAANTSPVGGRQRANSAAATGGQKTDTGSVDAIAWGLYAASTGGDPEWIGLLDADEPIFGTGTSASPCVITAYSHGLSVDQRLFYLAAPGAVTPTGISENTAYFVGTVPNGDSFTLSTTASNANPVDTTGAGAGLFCPYTALSIAQNATPEFAIGALIIQI